MRLDFWYEFGSTYSYPAAMRIEDVAVKAGVEISWRPFLLGPIFRSQGWETSPFNLYPAKGAYMWRDMERICSGLDIPFCRPDPFPQNGLLAARVSLTGSVTPLRPAFAKAVYSAEFGEGLQIDDPEVIVGLLAGLGFDPALVLGEAAETPVKDSLKEATSKAAGLQIFGAPMFIAEDGEMFWGNDRLEDAVAWVVGRSQEVSGVS